MGMLRSVFFPQQICQQRRNVGQKGKKEIEHRPTVYNLKTTACPFTSESLHVIRKNITGTEFHVLEKYELHFHVGLVRYWHSVI